MNESHHPADSARLQALHRERYGCDPDEVTVIRAHGSDRHLYRLRCGKTSVIGVVNRDAAENRAFVSFARHFRAVGVPVPEVLAVEPGDLAYLEEDLGDLALFDLLQRRRSAGDDAGIPADVADVYDRVVQWLPVIQIAAGRGVDFSACHPRARFDRQSMMWDLNYFKYHFLKLAHIAFPEQELENDFVVLADFLERAPADYFLFRDFQSRNIMVRDGQPWFIDFQGGRRGALHYDIASLLVDAKANLPRGFRERLLDGYLRALADHVTVDRDEFLTYFDAFTLIRLLQAMGAYGYRGFYERKAHFLQSVPYAIRNLEHLLGASRLPVRLPALWATLEAVVRSTRLRDVAPVSLPVTVRIESFSFKRGLPVDTSGHGGGFVFDCRLLPNPGREERFQSQAGDDAEVEAWLQAREDVGLFLSRTSELVLQAIDSYRARRFTHLSVAFGCTGGQHRSVFCATQLARGLRERPDIQVELQHRDVVRREATGSAT